MRLAEYDDNQLLEALANRGIDARTLKEFSNQEIYDEIGRRRKELDARIEVIKTMKEVK